MWINVTSILYDKIPLDIIRIAHYSFEKNASQKIFLSESLSKAPDVTRLKLEIVSELTIEFFLLRSVCAMVFSSNRCTFEAICAADLHFLRQL
jgi:hypothetical protein